MEVSVSSPVLPVLPREPKGTLPNVHGIKAALEEAMSAIGMPLEKLDLVRLNEAAPVIGDTAMETITETIITESSMIGHNPSTPAGAGEAVGRLLFHRKYGQRQCRIHHIFWLHPHNFLTKK